MPLLIMMFSIQQKLLILSIITVFSLSGCLKGNNDETNSQPSNVETNMKPTSLENIAQQTTVNISGKGSGSGVIIGKRGNTYYVLTAKHVVGIPPGELEDEYLIKIGQKEYTIDYNRVKKISKLDVAIVEFSSRKNYPVASLSKNLYPEQTVFISGWIDCLNQERYEFNRGKILTTLSSTSELPASDAKTYDKDIDFKEGYRVKYTNRTIRGLSGSPVFDQAGNVVAIHGKPGEDREFQYNFEDCPPLNDSYSNNWGIPVNQFLDSIQNSGITLQETTNYPKGNNSVKSTDEKSEPESSGGIFLRPEP
ncbi:MAG: trypsin-like peptidase domain-containing protein [Symploca sp. SIO2G7]|nr:trypsin-like peptidase domain-containing protein [Symploca sp. SIO2G7]